MITALLQHLATGRVVAELPVESATLTRILNAPGSLDVTIPLNVETSAFGSADVVERSAGIVLLRDSTPLGFGIIETTDADVAANTFKFGCLGWLHYLRNLYLRHDYWPTGVDQAFIVKWLVDYASAKSGAMPTGTSRLAATGRTRDRQWYGWERHSIGKLIEQMSDVIDGFNFRFDPVRTSTGFGVDMVLSYPVTGRPTNFVLELGGNVELLSQKGDGSKVANDVEAIGAGQGPEAPIVRQSNPNLLSTMPLWEAVETHADVSQMTTLTDKAARRLALGAQPVRLPAVRIGGNAEPRIGTFWEGDRVRVRGRYGLFDVDSDYLITEVKYDAATDVSDITTVPVEVLTA